MSRGRGVSLRGGGGSQVRVRHTEWSSDSEDCRELDEREPARVSCSSSSSKSS